MQPRRQFCLMAVAVDKKRYLSLAAAIPFDIIECDTTETLPISLLPSELICTLKSPDAIKV